MKYLKKFNENEFTRLAASLYVPYTHSKYQFTQPNDERMLRMESCSIKFPDNSEIKFKCRENLNSDTETLKLSVDDISVYGVRSGEQQAQLYLELYGNSIQFDDHTAYKMIRLYMNLEDLLDTDFDGYIFNGDKLGFSEVRISFNLNYDLNTRSIGIFKDRGYQINTIQEAIKMISNKDNWRKCLYENKDEFLFDLLDELDKIGNSLVYPIKINSKNSEHINLVGYLYLYYIMINKTPETNFRLS